MPLDPAPNNPDSPCAYCRAFSVGTSTADCLVCVCETACGAGRCSHAPGYRASPRPSPDPGTTDTVTMDGDPYGPPLPDDGADLERRWHPHPRAIQHAKALLHAEPDADIAVIPMFQPGKDESWWVSGQQVVTVFGVVLLSVNSSSPTGLIPSYSWARNTASAIAAARLTSYSAQHPDVRSPSGEIGTVAYAVVRRDSPYAAVFEDGSPDERHVLD